MPHHHAARLVRATVATLALALPASGLGAQLPSFFAPLGALARPTTTPGVAAAASTRMDDTLLGRSGKLRARQVVRTRGMRIPALERLFGDSSLIERPGVHAARDSAGRSLALITLVPFESKDRGRLGSYRMGFWPAERRAPRSAAYQNPDGFIEVTPENQDTPVSEHFRLRDFLTKDQRDVWPKYLVLREPLIDKLELIIDELESRGHRVKRMVVMSGFRTPQYNQQGVGRGGRAKDSRHQFGDAADVFVDNDGDGRMDDLNRDGRVNTKDAQIIIDAAERVESRHPEYVGGAGRYRATRAHGPFAHIDVRGTRARWKNG